MKYYVYISDAKVDMLLPQIPHDVKKRLATEFKIDLKILSASRRTETDADDNRVTRLEAVCDFIREFGNVGTVDAPDEYIEDTLTMKWVSAGDNPNYVYFTTTTEKTIFGLGGSARHMLGYQQNNKAEDFPNRSYSPFIIDALRQTVGDETGQPLDPKFTFITRTTEPKILLYIASRIQGGIDQRVEFIAKRLLQTTFPSGPVVLLASPLYVAVAE